MKGPFHASRQTQSMSVAAEVKNSLVLYTQPFAQGAVSSINPTYPNRHRQREFSGGLL